MHSINIIILTFVIAFQTDVLIFCDSTDTTDVLYDTS